MPISKDALLMTVVFCVYGAVIFWMNRRTKTFWNDAEGLTIDEFASVVALPLWLYVGIRLALAGATISATQVDYFEVLTWIPLATVAKRAVERFGFPGKRGTPPSTPSWGGGYGGEMFGGGYQQGLPQGQPPPTNPTG